MITNIYPPYIRQLFTNRKRELDILYNLVEDLQAGIHTAWHYGFLHNARGKMVVCQRLVWHNNIV